MKSISTLVFFCFLNSLAVSAQQADTILSLSDSGVEKILQQDTLVADSVQHAVIPVISSHIEIKKNRELIDILKENIFLNISSKPLSHIELQKIYISKDVVFYILVVLLLFIGILKVSWPRYFGNVIRVFFNTSLRQGQLTDQLVQARVPSLFFNTFFVFISGWYIYLLLNHFEKTTYDNWHVLLSCMIGLQLIYIIKFCTLKFAGWLTGYKQEAETYIFIVFLINKIISLCLLPVVIIIPFSRPELVNITIIISYVLIALMFLMRFFRSYGLLQSRLRVSGLHFFLYIVGIELLPLLLIYKCALIIMSKNL